MVSAPQTIIIAGSGALATELAAQFEQQGATVTVIPAGTGHPTPEPDAGPLDLLVVADDFEPPTPADGSVRRGDLAAAMHRLTYWPFRLAAALKPRLEAGQGRTVLLSTTTARMEHTDIDGQYLARPFRAAAHALWRCLSVEWQPAGITCAVIALDPGREPVPEKLALAIAGHPNEAFPVELTSPEGDPLGW